MVKIDVFAHVLLPKYYNKMLEINSNIPNIYAFTNIDSLKDMNLRRNLWNGETKQIISYANINAEDFCTPELSAKLCREANQELENCVIENNDMFPYGIGMIPLNNVNESLKILEEIKKSNKLIGVQLFTRHLGKSIADEEFRQVLKNAKN